MKIFLTLTLAVVLSSCSARVYHLDYTQYPKLPELPMSKVIHTVSEAIPPLEAKAYYGNYGGPGNHAQAPVDQMDEYFRQHDVSYLEGYKYREVRASDRQLVKNLESVDPAKLTPEGELYRKRAIKFFSSPVSAVVGKPLSILFGLRKKPIVIPGYGGRKEEIEGAFSGK